MAQVSQQIVDAWVDYFSLKHKTMADRTRTIAEDMDNKDHDSDMVVRLGRLNPYTSLIHWSDGSISKLVHETKIVGKKLVTRRYYKLHDVGIPARARAVTK